MMYVLLMILLIVVGYAISWGATVGAICLICLCFSWEFNLAIATGIWLILCLIWSFIPKGGAE